MKPHHKGYEKSHRDPRAARDSPDDLPPQREKAPRTGLQEYFVDGAGISRDVLQRQICFMLGNEARSKPATYNGVQGYRVTAVRPFTDKQLEDLIAISSEYLEEQREFEHTQRKQKKPPSKLPFEQSQTSLKHRHPQEQYREYPDRPYQTDSYTVSSPPGPFIDPAYNPQPNPGYAPRPGYPPGPQMNNPGYPPPGQPPNRPFQYDQYAPYQDQRMVHRDPSQNYNNPRGGDYGLDNSTPRYMPMDPHQGRPPAPMYPPTSMGPPDEQMPDVYSGHMDIDQGPYTGRGPGSGGAYPPQRRMATDDDDSYYPSPVYKAAPAPDKRRRDDDYHRRPGR